MATAERTSKATIDRYFEGYNESDPDRIAAVLAEDMTAHGLPGVDGPVGGREAYLGWAAGIAEVFPDLQLTVEDEVIQGDKVAVRMTVSGTQEGEFEGLPPTGTHVEVPAFKLFHLEDDRIAEFWYLGDGLGMLEQLGALD